MARTKAKIAGELRDSDFLTLASLMGVVPYHKVLEALKKCGLATQRYRKLPLEVMVYYVICMTLYAKVSMREVLRCILEGSNRLRLGLSGGLINGRGGISNARNRLGFAVMRELFDAACVPMATRETKGAHYRRWRLVAMDGSTLDLPDEDANSKFFGKPGASIGEAAFPKLRFVALLEVGTRAIFATAHGPYKADEPSLAKKALHKLCPGMLLLADRGFGGYPTYCAAAETGADLLFRVRGDMRLKSLEELDDGSYISRLHNSKNRGEHLPVRVIKYVLPESDEQHVLITSILDPTAAPASELAALYHERWEIETGYDEVKCHLKAPGECLRSKTPELVLQEFYGLLLAHYTVRSIMHKAALKTEEDPDRLSFTAAVCVIRRKITAAAFPPQPVQDKKTAPGDSR